MKKSILLISSITLVLLANDNYTNNDLIKKGEAIYQQTCISCHGADGNTNKDMQLVVKPRKLTKTILTEEQSFKIIKEGAHHWGAHADIMPAFKYVYSDDQIKAIAAYISHTFNSNRDKRIEKLLNESDPISEKDKEKMFQVGQKIFKRNCSMCHGKKGDGKSEYVEKSKASNVFIYPYNLTRTLLNEDQIFLYAKFGGHYWGTAKSDMPSWKKKYNDFQLKSVAKYVKQEIVKIKE